MITAAHNVRTDGVVDDEVLIRRVDGSEVRADVLAAGGPDLAVLQADVAEVPPVRFARLDRGQVGPVAGCWAIGYPRFKEGERRPGSPPLRDIAQVYGEIPLASNRRRGLFELRTTSTPHPLPDGALNESEWQGMSGAVVFADDMADGPLAVGVVSEHHVPEGSSALTIVPLTGLEEIGAGTGWWRRLGLDEWIVLPRPVRPEPVRPAPRHVALRRPLSDFTGRGDVIAEVGVLLTERLTDTAPVVVLYGMAGVGKTALANHIAYRLAPVFTYARILVDLGGEDAASTDAATIQILHGFGLFGTDLPRDPLERGYRVQELLRTGPSLLVLDNASRAEQVVPLLPESPGSAAIVTGRSALSSIEGADRVRLDPLPDEEGLRLFERIVGAEMVARDRDAGDEIVALLGGLPLAIRIAAADIASPAMSKRPLAFHAGRLADEQQRLIHLTGEDRGVRSSFDLSYRRLSADTARLFRRLGVLPGFDFTADLVASAVGVDRAEALLDELVDRQLIEVTGPAGTRYRLHDLIRLYARERAMRDDSAAERSRVIRDSLRWYARRLDAWMSEPGAHEHPPDPALEWFAEEHLNVQAALRVAHQNEEWTLLRDMSGALYGLLWYRGRWNELETTQAWGVEAARREGDETAELNALIHLAEARRALRRAGETPQLYERALQIARSRGDQDKEGWILTHYGDLQCDLGRPRAALGRYAEAAAIYRARDDMGAQIWLAPHISDAYRQLKQPEEAVRVDEEALRQSRRRGDPAEVAWCQWHLALGYQQLGRLVEAEQHLHDAEAYHRETGDRGALTTMLIAVARVHLQAGRPKQARTALTEALDLARAIDAPDRIAEISAMLDE